MRSGLYVGNVSHRRKSPFEHRLKYRTYSILVNLDELDRGDLQGRLLSHNKWNLFSIYDRDHGERDGGSLRAWIDQQLADAGIDLDGGQVDVLMFPRVLGYSFNPLTTWFCYHSDGSLKAVMYEIHNTFGHSHSHLVPVTGAEPYRHGFAKELHVSPFFDRAGGYSFTLRPPADRFSLSIRYATEEDLLTATMVASRRSLSTPGLLRVFLTHPLLTLKVIGGIHWEALKLLFKGARYRPVPKPPSRKVTLEGTLEEAA